MEMNALRDLTDPATATKPGDSDVDVLIGATHEVEKRLGGPQRSLMLWNPELWRGASLIRRYNVTSLCCKPYLSNPNQLALELCYHVSRLMCIS